MSNQYVLLPKWLTHGRITLAIGQLGHSYTFWTMPILIFSLSVSKMTMCSIMKHFCQFPGWHWWNDIERRYFSYVENRKKTYNNLPEWNWAFFAFAPLCWPWSKITFQHRLDRDWNCMASSYNWEFLGLLLFRNWFWLWALKLNKYHTEFLFHWDIHLL